MDPVVLGGRRVENRHRVTAAGIFALLAALLFAGTVVWMAAIWTHLGRGDSVLALWIGLPPSLACLGLSSLLERNAPSPIEPASLRSNLRRGTLAAFTVIVALLAGGHAAFHFNRVRCIGQAQSRVEAMFRTAPDGKFGAFKSMSGEGWSEAFWDISGSGAIVCDREGHFANGETRVRIRITPIGSAGDDAHGAGVPRIDGIDAQGIHVSINHAALWR